MHTFFNGKNELLHLYLIYVLSSKTFRHHMTDGKLITLFYLRMWSAAQTILHRMTVRLANNEMQKMWKQSWPNLSNYSNHFSGGQKSARSSKLRFELNTF